MTPYLAIPLGCVLAAASLSAQTPLTSVLVASGLDRPVGLTAASGDDRRLFVVEKPGRIRIVRDGQLLAAPFLDLAAKVSLDTERGLLGLVFHPDYGRDGWFYVSYTDHDGAVRVERYAVSADPDRADAASGAAVLGPIAQPFPTHNGGCLQFGPDGYLYIALGDGGGRDDPSCNAQNGGSLLGKVLRIDVDAGAPYAIPPDNPFVGDPNVRDEIWAFGLRNPWRFAFDRATGDLYIGDVGQDQREEVDFQPAGSRGGLNYGWKLMEGELCYRTDACSGSVPPCGDARLTEPVFSYPTGADCSVIGGCVYRGCAIPDLRGTYLYADFCSARIWSFRIAGGRATDHRDRTAELAPAAGSIDSIASFGEDADGELYVVDYGGEVFKIVPAGPPVFVDLGYGMTSGNGLTPRIDVCGRLDAGQSAVLRLREAPPGTAAAVVIGEHFNPLQVWGGTVVPLPPLLTLGVLTGADGSRGLPMPTGLGPASVFVQCLLLDQWAPAGFGISNAIRVDYP